MCVCVCANWKKFMRLYTNQIARTIRVNSVRCSEGDRERYAYVSHTHYKIGIRKPYVCCESFKKELSIYILLRSYTRRLITHALFTAKSLIIKNVDFLLC